MNFVTNGKFLRSPLVRSVLLRILHPMNYYLDVSQNTTVLTSSCLGSIFTLHILVVFTPCFIVLRSYHRSYSITLSGSWFFSKKQMDFITNGKFWKQVNLCPMSQALVIQFVYAVWYPSIHFKSNGAFLRGNTGVVG